EGGGLPVATQAHRIDDAVELDVDGRSFARPPIKPREQPHGHSDDSRAPYCHGHAAAHAFFFAGWRSYARAEPLRFHMRRSMWVSFERMKSAMRGAISARKREPLNTP